MKSFSSRLLFLAAVGALVSAYLLYHYVDVRSGYVHEPSFCSINATFDCDRVATSAYSTFFGIPVASYGLFFYLAFILLIFSGQPRTEVVSPEAASRRAAVRFFLASLTIPVTLMFAYISKVYVEAYCLVCMLLYVVNFTMVAVAWLDPDRSANVFSYWLLGAMESADVFFPGAQTSVKRWPFLGLCLATLAFVLILPVALMEGYIKPAGASENNREAYLAGLKDWRSQPTVELPNFDGSPDFSPDIIFGNPTAKVTIVEFSDLECPACKRYSVFLKPALEKYKARARFVFKHFPLDLACNRLIREDKHKYACRGARMAVCAGAQGGPDMLWKFVDAAYSLDAFDDSTLTPLPAKLGISQDAFAQCLENPASLARVKSDIELGMGLHVVSTPTIYVNGKMVRILPKYIDGVIGMIIDEVEGSAAKNSSAK